MFRSLCPALLGASLLAACATSNLANLKAGDNSE
jgi:hypothetical protein